MTSQRQVFVSYLDKTHDSEVKEVVAALEQAEITCFYSARDAPRGVAVLDSLTEAIRRARALVVLVDGRTRGSDWLNWEVGYAMALSRPIYPVLLPGAAGIEDIPSPIRQNLATHSDEISLLIEPLLDLISVEALGVWDPDRTGSAALSRKNAFELHWANIHKGVENIGGKLDEDWKTSNRIFEPIATEDLRHSDRWGSEPLHSSGLELLPPQYSDSVVVHSIHAGGAVPKSVTDAVRRSGLEDELKKQHLKEKDWGASYLAVAVAAALNIPRMSRMRIARAVMDFGRFPGITREGGSFLGRYCINKPLADVAEKHDSVVELLFDHYDRASDILKEAASGKSLLLGIHTYDPNNQAKIAGKETERPPFSLLYTSDSYHRLKRLPLGLFDPLFPDEIVEYTADGRLLARLQLDLQREGYTTLHNFPYCLPEGSLEVRSQVHSYFEFLRDQFRAERGIEPSEEDPYSDIWEMLLDTNLRSVRAELLRSFIHRALDVTGDRAIEGIDLHGARGRYLELSDYSKRHQKRLLEQFRATRCNSLALEVRKDLVWKFDKDSGNPRDVNSPENLRIDNVTKFAFLIARAILRYYNVDLQTDE